jgi:hypothetical protein
MECPFASIRSASEYVTDVRPVEVICLTPVTYARSMAYCRGHDAGSRCKDARHEEAGGFAEPALPSVERIGAPEGRQEPA